MGGSLAPLDRHHSEAIDYRPACIRAVWRRHDGRHWIYKKFIEYRIER
jgi:hypothetical protein